MDKNIKEKNICKVIELKTVENVKMFVDMISKIEAEADLACINRRHIVDAKSILGVFSLNIMEPLELIIFDEPENEEKYKDIIERFASPVAI